MLFFDVGNYSVAAPWLLKYVEIRAYNHYHFPEVAISYRICIRKQRISGPRISETPVFIEAVDYLKLPVTQQNNNVHSTIFDTERHDYVQVMGPNEVKMVIEGVCACVYKLLVYTSMYT